MATQFDSFDRSPLDGFFQSTLLARGQPQIIRGAALRLYQRNDEPYGIFVSDTPSQDFGPRVGKTWSTIGTNRTKRYRVICEFGTMGAFPYFGSTLRINCSFAPPVVTTLEPFVLQVYLVTGAGDFYNSSALLGQLPSSSFIVGNNIVALNSEILSGVSGQPSLFLLLATDMEIVGAGVDPFAAKASSLLGRESIGIGFSVSIASS